MNESNEKIFSQEYKAQLKARWHENPAAYQWPLKDLDIIHAKMFKAIKEGVASLDGPAVKGTCKVLGIKNTYKSVAAFLTENKIKL